MEDGSGACAFLAKAAAALTVFSLLPVAFGGTAPSHAPSALLPISLEGLGAGPFAVPTSEPSVDWATGLFASFTYHEGQVVGSYVQFGYDETYGGTVTTLLARQAWPPITFLPTLRIEAFIPTDRPSAQGPIFEAPGYLVDVIAHDDPTGLLEVRTEGVSRTVWIDLPPTATNLSQANTPGSWPASRLTYTLEGEQARFLLGRGSFVVEGTKVVATMSSFDLLLFRMVPAQSSQKAEWKAIFDAIGTGAVVAEVDLVARPSGGWMANRAHYRIDVTTTIR